MYSTDSIFMHKQLKIPIPKSSSVAEVQLAAAPSPAPTPAPSPATVVARPVVRKEGNINDFLGRLDQQIEKTTAAALAKYEHRPSD